MKKHIIVSVLALWGIFFLTACTAEPGGQIPVLDKENSALLSKILSESTAINELSYEEVPVTSYYSGSLRIENKSRVWLKGKVLKTEHITEFYRDNQLVDSEITGELYDYDTLQKTRYYLGGFPEQAKAYLVDRQNSFVVPREQTILWYLDRILPESATFTEEVWEGETCLVIEILKNNLGSTKIWLSTEMGLPVKIQNDYNGRISERLYNNFQLGEGAVSAEDLKIPEGALTL